ncbi:MULTISPECIES: GTP cyclohydrolase I FolE [Aneurinibacillus]|nr:MULTISPECIES: GTP cyclohydrolase I FolE [Aneurinibacillus]MED0677128.1 GTP cyclohydrolase I FolE [Aneurinibacillus thermoaerophilus]MED0679412.1 GTP cyclohydrolase I FolE [Aneurinibacillus thermoaerophilus]MED0738017.1 GTP cyclohydrolase I FolE [Aneurinibacillus thermoaerophilus]MED0756438.1 GTP cyclohydrolase I FolE [Aneurinibacillus thermoaerophilus]MED0761163.1 GTP cyclohydrolase I FolE [Aneurinibacillus thermoaerophilus]
MRAEAVKSSRTFTDPIEKHFYDIISLIGEDPEREGLQETPKRIAKMYREIFSGLHEDPAEVLGKTFPAEGTNDIVIVQDIPFYSVCEHHFVPFFGKVHIGYIPNGRIVGLSKFARLVEILARRPQVQERITNQIVDTLEKVIEPVGAIAVVEAEHLCMSMRGVKKPGSKTRTIARRGIFEKDNGVQEERFFRLLEKE